MAQLDHLDQTLATSLPGGSHQSKSGPDQDEIDMMSDGPEPPKKKKVEVPKPKPV